MTYFPTIPIHSTLRLLAPLAAALLLPALPAKAALVPVSGLLQGDTATTLGSSYGNFAAGSTQTVCENQGPYGNVCSSANAHISAAIAANRLALNAQGHSVGLITVATGAYIAGHLSFQLTTPETWQLSLTDNTPIYGNFTASLSDSSGTLWSDHSVFGTPKTQNLALTLAAGRYDLSLSLSALPVVGTGGDSSVGLSLASVAPVTSVDPVPVPAAVWLFGSALAALSQCVRRGKAPA